MLSRQYNGKKKNDVCIKFIKIQIIPSILAITIKEGKQHLVQLLNQEKKTSQLVRN